MTILEYYSLQNEAAVPSKCIIRCPFSSCNTRIILLSTVNANKAQIEGSPDMIAISESSPVPANTIEGVSDYFRVEDVWDFDNIGVSKPSEDLKQPTIKNKDASISLFKIERLLICSECDKGPIGFAGFEDGETDVKKLKYFLSCNSVLYDVS